MFNKQQLPPPAPGYFCKQVFLVVLLELADGLGVIISGYMDRFTTGYPDILYFNEISFFKEVSIYPDEKKTKVRGK